MSLTPSSYLLCKKWKFSLYNNSVLPKREAFSLPHFLTNFLLFSLMFSPGSYLSPLTVNSTWWLKSLTVILYQALMLKQLCLVKFETGHVASASVSNRFGVASFLTLGRQTLLFIYVVSFHLTPVDDLKRKRSPFILHFFCICTTSSSLEKKNPPLSTKWSAFLLQVLTLQKMTPPL